MDFQLTIKGLDESLSIKIGEYTKQILESLIQKYNIDIDNLSNITITTDFEGELNFAASQLNRNPIEFTNSNNLRAIAKLVTKHENGKVKQHILIVDAAVFNSAFENDKFETTLTRLIHLFHHELIHIQDHNCKNKYINGYGSMVLNYMDSIYYEPAESAWSEYYANRESFNTATDESINDFINSFEIVINQIPNQNLESIEMYKNHKISLDELMQILKRNSILFFQASAYIIGYLHADNEELSSAIPELYEKLVKHRYEKYFDNLSDSLKAIYSIYPSKIHSIRDFLPISNIVKNLYTDLGIEISEINSMQVNVQVN